jgi:predicted ester cyclase
MGEAEQVIQRHVDAFNAHDADADPWSEDAYLVNPGGELRGREQVLGFERNFWAAFPDVRLEIVRRIADGPMVASEGRLVGTHTGTLSTPNGDVPATGRSIDFRWMCMQEVRGEEIVFEELYFNESDFLTQLGLIEEPAAAEA